MLLDLTDSFARFPIAYGYQPVRGWAVKHYETLLTQSVQITKQQALGEGPWDGVERLYAEQFPIDPADYHFHNGDGADVADAFFADEEPHLWTAHISAKCPAGITPDQADQLFGIYRTLRTPNFNGAGVQIDSNGDPIGGGDPRNYYFFKPNPANVAIDQILRWGQRENTLINWPAFVDWRDYNDEEIDWDNTAYTPRSLSLTGASGGSVSGTLHIRVSTMTATDESSASRKTVDLAYDSYALGGQSAVQVNWLVKGDELSTPAPPGDITGFRVYVGTTPGVWIGYFDVANPALRTLLVTTTAGTSAGSPLDTCTSGLLTQIPRFECGLFFVPPYSLASALDRICQISCADWQWSGFGTSTYRNDKVRFLSPATRSSVFTLDRSQIAPGSFKTWAVDRRSRPNQVIVNSRDRDDEFLNDGVPVVRDRSDMQDDDGTTRTVSLDFGTCHRSQAERGASYYARTMCDLDQLATLKGSPKTYHVLPADVVLITSETADWENEEFLVRKKSENIEGPLGDPLIMQVYAADAYSDTNHSALPRPLRRARFDPLSAPPVATNLVLTADDLFTTGIVGDFDFGTFAAKQIARIFVKGPADVEPDDSTYAMVMTVIPNSAMQGHFEFRVMIPGKYWVKVQTESELGVTAPSGHPVEDVDLRPLAMTDPSAIRDASYHWLIAATLHPRTAEQPADGECLFGLTNDWSDIEANTVLTLPMVSGTSQAALFAGTTGGYGQHQEMWIDIVAVTSTGTSSVEVTAADLPGSPVTVTFGVTMGDPPSDVAINLLAALEGDPDIAGFFVVSFNPSGTGVVLDTQLAAANDPTFDFTATRLTFTKEDIAGDDPTTNHAYRNNAASFDPLGAGFVVTSIQAITEGFQRFDFEPSIDFNDPLLNLTNTGFSESFGSALHSRANAEAPYPYPDESDCPLSYEWTIPTNYYDSGEFAEGTVKEVWRSFGNIILTRNGIDPGYDPFHPLTPGDGTDHFPESRRGPRYTFLVSSGNISAYEDYSPGGGVPHIVKISLGDAIPFPLRLTSWANSPGCYIRSATFGVGGTNRVSTILSDDDQIASYPDHLVQQRLFMLMRQVSKFPGVKGAPLIVVAPPL